MIVSLHFCSEHRDLTRNLGNVRSHMMFRPRSSTFFYLTFYQLKNVRIVQRLPGVRLQENLNNKINNKKLFYGGSQYLILKSLSDKVKIPSDKTSSKENHPSVTRKQMSLSLMRLENKLKKKTGTKGVNFKNPLNFLKLKSFKTHKNHFSFPFHLLTNSG